MSFRLIGVTGGRDFFDKEFIFEKLDAAYGGFPFNALVHGAASGVDSLCGEWARVTGVQEIICPANWEYYGNRAGPIRNSWMAHLCPNFLIVFPGGKGTFDMANKSTRLGTPCWFPKTNSDFSTWFNTSSAAPF